MDAATPRDAPGGTSAEAPPSAFSSLLFADVCELFEAIREVNHTGYKGSARKRELLTRFFEHKTRVPEHQPRLGSFDLYRLMLPNIDKERGTYNLKEAALARCVGSALGLKRHESPDFLRLEGWRKSGSGDFARTVFEVVAHHRPTRGVARHTVGDVNAALDRLCAARAADEKAAVMRALLDATDATQMFWITQVILKDVKIGYGETAVLRHYHQDAVDLYNLCCDLRRVCETLAVRGERLKRQDLEPGALVKAMMASRAHGCAKAFEAMRDRPFVIETKFDGERIQVHRTDATSPLRYFTRNNNDFGPRGYDVLDRLFRARLKPSKTRCVFDGELVVWNTRDGVYAPFGYIKSLVNAIRDNRGGDERCVPEDPRGPVGRRRAPLRVASARRARGETRGGSVRGRGRRRRRRRLPARRRRLRRPG
jgi:DNA ligase-4